MKSKYILLKDETRVYITHHGILVTWAKQLSNSSHKKLRILDPAIGSGIFLLACKSVLREKELQLFGGDIDPIAVFSTRMQLYLIDETNDSIVNSIVERFLDQNSTTFGKKRISMQ